MDSDPDAEEILAAAGYRCAVQTFGGLTGWQLTSPDGGRAAGLAPSLRDARADAAFVALALAALARARRRTV
jgi:hypothetical protein